jgi:hypothetical protein
MDEIISRVFKVQSGDQENSLKLRTVSVCHNCEAFSLRANVFTLQSPGSKREITFPTSQIRLVISIPLSVL